MSDNALRRWYVVDLKRIMILKRRQQEDGEECSLVDMGLGRERWRQIFDDMSGSRKTTTEAEASWMSA
jgi:hypothetical protein